MAKVRHTELVTNQCTRCGDVKPVSEFRNTGRTTKYGLTRYSGKCKDCLKRRDAEYRANMSDVQKRKYKQLFDKHNKRKSEERVRKSTVHFRQCVRCGQVETFNKKPSAKRCDKCREEIIANRPNPIRPAGLIDNCQLCNNPYALTGGGNEKYCPKCRIKVQKAHKRVQKRERKAFIKISKAGPVVVDEKVFKRDKWRCVNCGIKVQKKEINKPDEATIDHIIPISKGGKHAYTNLQTLCRQCNSRKSTALRGQLVLQI